MTEHLDPQLLWLLPALRFVASHRAAGMRCRPCRGRRWSPRRGFCRFLNLVDFCYRGHWRSSDPWRPGGPNVTRIH